VVCDPVIEGFGCRAGGEAQDLAAGDSSEARGAVDEEEAQRLHARDPIAIGALAGGRWTGNTIVQEGQNNYGLYL
jgi:hypothetical protein